MQKDGEVADWQTSTVGTAEDEVKRKRREKNRRREMRFEEAMLVCLMGLIEIVLFIGSNLCNEKEREKETCMQVYVYYYMNMV